MTNAEAIETTYLAWLAGTNIPLEILRDILMHYVSGEAVYQAVLHREPAIREIISEQTMQKLFHHSDGDRMKETFSLIRKHNIQSITMLSPLFPNFLKEISQPVSILFYQGNPECLIRRKLSMVGSRSASAAGLKAAEKTARELSCHGVSIVSGFAVGIDTACHQGCLKGGSPTIAVMGCGLERNYPADNRQLRTKILDTGGVLLSEYAPGEPPLASHFPVRNRIIAALGEAVIVMEAKIKSGSMTTVSHALEQGKDVFVYPGDPSSLYCEGNHQLLREGAIFFTSAGDILEDMKWLDNPRNQVQNIDCAVSARGDTSAEKAIYAVLLSGAAGFEQLAVMTNLAPSALMSALTMMQIRGEIESLPGKIYQIRRS